MVLKQAVNVSSTTAKHTVGQIWEDRSAGKAYQYIVAGAALAVGEAVSIAPATFTAALTTKALVDAQHAVGVVVVAIASGSFGWVQIEGTASCKLLVNCAQDVSLYSSATPGALDDDPTSQTRIRGIVLLATITTAGVYPCYLMRPAA